MDTQRVTWPSNVRNLQWPKTGITYSYENRGYIIPDKLERWLEKAFGGRDKADYRVRFTPFGWGRDFKAQPALPNDFTTKRGRGSFELRPLSLVFILTCLSSITASLTLGPCDT